MQSLITHTNQGATNIMVDISPQTIENYVMQFGKRRTIKTCTLSAVSRIVKDITMMEQKTKLTIYYTENGKEKRFGGMGFAIEGNSSDVDFQSLIAFLEQHLPSDVVWQDKAIEKASSVSSKGGIEFPTAAKLNFLLFQYPSHSGERKMIVGFQLFFGVLYALIPILMLLMLFSQSPSVVAILIVIAIAVPLGWFAVKILQMAFVKGGIAKLIVNKDTMIINGSTRSTAIQMKDITNIAYKVISLTIKQSNTGAKTNSLEYNFEINHHTKFTMGEKAALQFIKKTTELNLPIQSK